MTYFGIIWKAGKHRPIFRILPITFTPLPLIIMWGEEITDAQAEFSRKYVDIPWGKNSVWQILTWLSVLLMEVVAISGGWLDFEEYEQDVDFVEMEEMLNMLVDVFIDLTDTPLHSNPIKQ